ncbi:MAG: hypothetical protein ABSB15_15480 [Bryobacteraceae bacterium]|jgi:hypothetical protein
MANGLKDVIAQLDRQKTAIERALEALREIGGIDLAPPAPVKAQTKTRRKAKRKSRITPEGRKRLAEAMRARWAARRAASKKRGA